MGKFRREESHTCTDSGLPVVNSRSKGCAKNYWSENSRSRDEDIAEVMHLE